MELLARCRARQALPENRPPWFLSKFSSGGSSPGRGPNRRCLSQLHLLHSISHDLLFQKKKGSKKEGRRKNVIFQIFDFFSFFFFLSKWSFFCSRRPEMPPQNTTTRFPGCQKISLRIKKLDRFPGGGKRRRRRRKKNGGKKCQKWRKSGETLPRSPR